MVHFVHLSVSGVHVDYVRVRHFVDYDEVMQLSFHYDVGNGGLGHQPQCIELGAHAFGRQPQLGGCFYHSQHIGSLLVGEGILADACHGKLQPVVGTYRGEAGSPTVRNVVLFDFDSFSESHNCFLF